MLRTRDRIQIKEKQEREERERIARLEREVVHLGREEKELRRELNELEKKAHSATLTIGDSSMPAAIVVGGNGAKAVFTEFTGPNGTGNPIAPIQTPVFSSSDATVATVDQSGNVTAVAPGTATISAVDNGNKLSASDTVTVTAAVTPPPPVAQSATLVVTAN